MSPGHSHPTAGQQVCSTPLPCPVPGPLVPGVVVSLPLSNSPAVPVGLGATTNTRLNTLTKGNLNVISTSCVKM